VAVNFLIGQQQFDIFFSDHSLQARLVPTNKSMKNYAKERRKTTAERANVNKMYQQL